MISTNTRLHKPAVAGSSPAAATCHSPAEEYHGWPETSCSDLKLLRESPRKYYLRKVAGVAPPASSAAFDYGTLLHTWGELGDEEFWRRAAVPDASLCTAAGAMGAKAKGWLDDLPPDAIPVSPADEAKLRPQTEALLAHPEVRRIIAATEDAEFNVRSTLAGHSVRGRIDGRTAAYGFDWKTTKDPNPLRTWWRAVIDFGYHLQSAFYTELLTHIGMPRERLRFVVTSTVWPYECAVVVLPTELCAKGHRECLRLLDELQSRREWDCWERHDTSGVVTLDVPAFAMKGAR